MIALDNSVLFCVPMGLIYLTNTAQTTIIQAEGCYQTGRGYMFNIASFNLSCEEPNCYCDGSGTGYRGCQSCCCVTKHRRQSSTKHAKDCKGRCFTSQLYVKYHKSGNHEICIRNIRQTQFRRIIA